jgi:hypothetical protein
MQLALPERPLDVRTLDSFPAFHGPEGSIPNSQELSTCYYPWPEQSNQHELQLYFCNLNIYS